MKLISLLQKKINSDLFNYDLNILHSIKSAHSSIRNHKVIPSRKKYGAIMVIKINELSNIKYSYGERTADYIKNKIINRIQKCMLKDDLLENDDYNKIVITLRCLSDDMTYSTSIANVISNEIICILNKSISYENLTFIPSYNIGVNVFENKKYTTNFLNEALIALGYSMKSGKNTYLIFDEKMKESRKRELQLVSDIHYSIKNDRFNLVYQPIMDSNKKIVYLEVLLRWSYSNHIIEPDEFIPIAEDNDMIDELDCYVIRKSIFECTISSSNNITHLSINISPIHFQKHDFIEQIKACIPSSKYNGIKLTFEITEGVLIDDFTDIHTKIMALKKMGIDVSLDDFGTGYASLNYIKKLAINTMKIDRSFTNDILENSNSLAIIKAIITMATSMKIKVIAEGIENDEQFKCLKELSCELFQGYFLSMPLPIKDIIELGDIITRK